MTLPRRGSRTLEHGDRRYRWKVSTSKGQLQLIVHDEDVGQVLLTHFERHNLYERSPQGSWSKIAQGRAITPDVVRRIIDHGLVNGWRPTERGKPPMQVWIWASDQIAPLPPRSGPGVALRDLAVEQVGDLRFDLSLDPHWRRILLNAEVRQRFPVPADYASLRKEVRESGLHFAVFNDGGTSEGWVVFGIESIEFPDVVMYTTNSTIVDW